MRPVVASPFLVLSLFTSGLLVTACTGAREPARIPNPAAQPKEGIGTLDRAAWAANQRGDHEEALRLNLLACEDGLVRRCSVAANLLLDGTGVPRDVHRAGELHAVACKRGHLLSCWKAGRLYSDGTLPQDAARAFELRARGCELPPSDDKGMWLVQGSCCLDVGLAYRDGEGASKDMVSAGKAFGAGCQLEHGRSCLALAELLQQNLVSTPRKRASAKEFRELDCEAAEDAGARERCAYWGQKVIIEDAFELAEKGCNFGEVKSCLRAADWLGEYPIFLKRRSPSPYLKKACELGRVEACLRYVRTVHYTVETAPDSSTFDPKTQLGGIEEKLWGYEAGCKLGHANSCIALANDSLMPLEKRRTGVAGACKAGVAEACKKLEDPFWNPSKR